MAEKMVCISERHLNMLMSAYVYWLLTADTDSGLSYIFTDRERAIYEQFVEHGFQEIVALPGVSDEDAMRFAVDCCWEWARKDEPDAKGNVCAQFEQWFGRAPELPE